MDLGSRASVSGVSAQGTAHLALAYGPECCVPATVFPPRCSIDPDVLRAAPRSIVLNVSDGTHPLGSTWQMNPLPNTRDFPGGDWPPPKTNAYQFPPPCHETAPPEPLGHGICSGEWITNITVFDKLRVPSDLPPGEYVLGYRMDCESSAQVWSSCADITITAP